MSDYPALIDAALRPELAALAVVDLEAARRRVRAMQDDRQAFIRGSLGLGAQWLVRKVGGTGTWVWSPGDAGHGSFATQAVGRPDQDGIVPVTFDLSDVEDEHPAPWRWDFVRLFASLVLSKPEQKGSEFSALVTASLDGYAEAMAGEGEGGGDARPDPATLPAAVLALIDEDAGGAEDAHAAHLASRIQNDDDDARLRLGPEQLKDLSARAFFLPALSTAYSDDQRIQAIDVVRRSPAASSPLARRQWLALARERVGPRGTRLRLLEISERPPSALSRCLVMTPFMPSAGPALRLTVPVGGDPYQRVLHGPATSYLVRSLSHARGQLAIATLPTDDLARLSRLWGWLLAAFHVRGLRALRADVPERARLLAAEAGAARKDIARAAWEHAAFLEKAHACFRKMAQEWES